MSQLDLADTNAGARPGNARASASPLVFVGIQVSWKRQIGDLRLSTELAEKWEPAFDHWSIEERNVHLGQPALGYGVYLFDGSAQFTVQIPHLTLGLVRKHVADLLEALNGLKRKSVSIMAQAQYLEPVTGSDFETLLGQMSGRLYNAEFAGSLGAKITDISYLVDVEIEGQWFQINSGPLRAHEVPQRIHSKLRTIPELARYYGVTSRADVTAGFEMDAFFKRMFRVGESVATELQR